MEGGGGGGRMKTVTSYTEHGRNVGTHSQSIVFKILVIRDPTLFFVPGFISSKIISYGYDFSNGCRLGLEFV